MAFVLDDETTVSAQDAFNSTRDQRAQQPQTNFTPPSIGYGDANQMLNYGDNNAAPVSSPITPSYVDTSYQQPAYDFNAPVEHGASAYDLNYGHNNSTDANNDGLNDITGWANGVVQDFSSPSGFSYNGIPTTSDGAPYNPGPQQPSYETGYNLDFASPLGGTANDAPVRPYTGDYIYQNPDTGGVTFSPDFQQYNNDTGNFQPVDQYPFDPNRSYPAGSAYDAMANHPSEQGGILGALGNLASDVRDLPGTIVDWGQRVNARAADSQGSNFLEDFGNAASGNHLINVLSGKDPNELPGPLPYVTDVAASPMSLIPGPEGIGFASNYGRNILAGLAGSGASYGANEVLPEDMNPALRGVLVGGAGLLGGIGGYYAPEAAGAAARGVGALDRLINEPVPGGAFGEPVTKGMAIRLDDRLGALAASPDAADWQKLGEVIRSDQGKPVVLYHGSETPGIAELLPGERVRGTANGLFFTKDPDLAGFYGQHQYVVHTTDAGMLDLMPETSFAAFAKGALGLTGSELDDALQMHEAGQFYNMYGSRGFQDEIVNTAKGLGFKGVIFPDSTGEFGIQPSYVLFDSVSTAPRTGIPNVMPEGDMGAGIPTKLGRGGSGAAPDTTTFTGPLPKPADLGDSGIRAALGTKEATTREAGPIGEVVGKIPGVKKAAGIVNPSINLERPIHVANQAEAAVKADLSTKFAATRKPILDEIKASGLDGGSNAPEYIGPAKNPIKDTFIDRVENPQDYRLTQPQKNLIQRIATRDAENVNLARGQYNADVGLYAPKNEGAAYVPHINANEDIIQRSAKAEAALTNPRIAKERVYDTARERAIASAKFKPETDPARLLEAHDNAIANMAGKETFKAGAGGLNKAEAIAQVNPGLAKRYDALKTKLQSMKGTASRLDERTSNAIDTFLKSGQTEEDMAALREGLHPVVGKNAVGKEGPNFGKDRIALNRDIAQVKQQIDAIRPAWKNFNLQERGYELSPYTYKYHSPEEAASIAGVKETSNGRFIDKVTGISEASRESVLGSDISPLTIQGQLRLASDPVSTAIGFAKMLKGGGAGLEEVARTEPELVSRFTQARGRALGNVSGEFDQSKSLIARVIPGAAKAERALFKPMQRIEYESWKRTVNLLEKVYPDKPQAWIDHEAANALSKTNPALSSVERGVSPARAAIERTALTSTSFLSTPALVMKDATSALAKLAVLQKPSGRELIALKHTLTLAGMIETASLASAVINADARGRSPEDAIKKALIPGNKEFMAIQFGNHNVPIGGPFRSFIAGLSPRYRDGKWEAPDIPRFLMSKTAPLLRTQIDLLRNQDYSGNKIMTGPLWERILKAAEYEGEAFIPLTAGAVPQGIRNGDSLGDIAANAGTQAMGANVTKQTGFDQLNVTSRQMFGKDYSDLNPLQRQQAKDAVDYQSSSPDVQKSQAATDQLRQANIKAQSEIDAQGPGQQWRDDYHKLQERVRGQIQDNQIRNPFTGTPYGSEMDKAIKEWGSTIDANTNGVTTNWDAVDKWMADNPDKAALVNEYMSGKKNTDLTPMVTEYKADSKALADSGYFDYKDNIWKEIVKDDSELSKFPTYYDWKASIENEIRSSVDPGTPKVIVDGIVDKVVGKIPVTKIYSKVTNTAETAWIAQHPQLAGIAYKWGYLTPTKAERAIIASGDGQ